nr:hypothetical protein [Virgibacillus pantothenticus]
MKNSKKISLDGLMRVFIYVALITLAVSIIVPVAWVFLASIKQNKEFMAVLGHFQKEFILPTLSKLFKKRKWVSTY